MMRLTSTTLTNFSTNYLVMCEVCTDIGGIKLLYHGCPPVRELIHSLKLVNHLQIQADKTWYNHYMHVIPVKMDLERFSSAHALSLIILVERGDNSMKLIELGSCWIKRNIMHRGWVTIFDYCC